MKKKIQREGLTEENKNLLDVYLLGNRITQSQYEELMQLEAQLTIEVDGELYMKKIRAEP